MQGCGSMSSPADSEWGGGECICAEYRGWGGDRLGAHHRVPQQGEGDSMPLCLYQIRGVGGLSRNATWRAIEGVGAGFLNHFPFFWRGM